MAKYRQQLPQLEGGDFLTDGGMETTFVFHRGMELPHFAAFPLLDSDDGRSELLSYIEPYILLAQQRGVGFILDTPTWRANADWGHKLGYDRKALHDLNLRAVDFAEACRNRWETRATPVVISGIIGPRGDAYKGGQTDVAEAHDYHADQVASFAQSAADMVSAMTINTVEEATGIALAAAEHGIPCVVSFTVETNGRLLNGTSLQHAIERTDDATNGAPVYYMVNCAHPTHFDQALAVDAPWVRRIHGLRANASAKSHAELDESETLDIGDPADLGRRYRTLRRDFPGFRILGGCCGTDHRHVAAICEACTPSAGLAA
ncbi:homocysteine S-methyltransferase family protein [Rhizobium sp. SL42]|uniref:homocysteine S-methyltransferase family protein n=1 Tax=Rhizobium sp. SL42 TaxID=2806346 RepID=UPI001F1D8B36|nr:homocysteine S-methyltransferase family protein [Rhizobium sp. SL42]UJW73723.1 homocysteine S-methyltransferase family protein [Rhizobium sp. SL42]